MSPLPAGWRLADPITIDAAAGHAYRAGFRGEGGATIVALAIAESSLIPNNRNVNTNGSIDRGVLQINTVHTSVTDSMADDPAQAFAFAWDLTRGGTKFTDWSTFFSHPRKPRSGAGAGPFAAHMGDARAAMKRVTDTAGPSGALPAVSSAATTATAELAGDEINVPGGIIPSTIERLPQVPFTAGDILLQGRRVRTMPVGHYLIGATLELSVDEVSQLTVTVGDPIGASTFGVFFAHGTTLDLGDLRSVVTTRQWSPGPALDQLQVTALSARAEKLRQADALGNAKTWDGPISATHVLHQEATRVGLYFVGEGGPKYSSIVREGTPTDVDTDAVHARRKRGQSTYELGLDYARREGKWFFEAAGVLYFGRPTWLARHLTVVTVRWRTPPGRGYLTPVEAPDCSVDVDDDSPNRSPGPRSISLKLPRGVADRIRPGMALAYSGTPGFDTVGFTKDRLAPVAYLVTGVTIDLLDESAPVSVSAREAVDPTPDPDDGDPIVGASSSSSGDGPAAGRSSNGPSALDFVTICLAQAGDSYRYGAEVDPKDPDPDVFDCSELIQWACARLGVTFVDGTGAQIGAISRAGLELPVAEAAKTRGAVLWHPGHIAVSLGDGQHTIEAMGRKYGVLEGKVGTRFTRGGMIPGLAYATTSGRVQHA